MLNGVDSQSEHSMVAICKAAADELRLDILRVLRRDSFGVQELASIFAVPQPLMSHHLKILAKCGLVVTRRQGNSVFYRRNLLKNQNHLNLFQGQLYSALDADPIDESYASKMGQVNKERALQSRLYFERNASKFAEHQGLLCELAQYLPNLNELLDLMEVSEKGRVMEVGPGQGVVLKELVKRFGYVVALDNSQEMLELTRQNVDHKSRRIEFINSSLEAYPIPSAKFDAVVLNMVMHHLPSPAQSFQKLSQIVSPQGYVLIADLCSHNQDWTRESCGDLWLGFDPQDLSEWAKSAGFEEAQSLYLGLKNGFQIQLKLFSKF